jgi:hypothetical protein
VNARALWRSSGPALSCTLLLGVFISVLPHLAWWVRSGSPVWFADSDDLLYMCSATRSFHENPFTLLDPVPLGIGPTIYPWIQFGPGMLVARALGFGIEGLNLVWRILAGGSISLGFFLLFKHFVERPWRAAALSFVCLADAGFMTSHLIGGQLTAVWSLLRAGSEGLLTQPLLGQWRLITPGLSLFYLLLHVWLLVRLQERPSHLRFVLAALSVAGLFYVYFYYWTAVLPALGLLAILDRPNWRRWVGVGALGTLLGLPALLMSAATKRVASVDWLPRIDMFLPVPRSSDLFIPRIPLALAAIALVWLLRRRRDLWYLWLLVAVGLAMQNHQLVSGLQVQNGHWLFVWGPALSLLLLLCIAPYFNAPSARRGAVLVSGCLAFYAVGLAVRWLEATRSRASVMMTQAYLDLAREPLARPFVTRAGVAGDLLFIDLAVIAGNLRPLDGYAVSLSPSISNDQLDERIALNAILQGRGRSDFELSEKGGLSLSVWGPWARNVEVRAARLAHRLWMFDQLALDPMAAVDRLGVRYVGLAARQSIPTILDRGWTTLAVGPRWRIWERTP